MSGNAPFSTYFTQVRNAERTSCSVLQATVQAWQPMHVRWSMTKPYFTSTSFPRTSVPASIFEQVAVRR